MFGYVRPALNQLTAEDKQAYKSAYCGLCHAMGHRFGWLARFTLNYDFTFLAILHYAGKGERSVMCCRCPAHFWCKPMECLCGTGLDTAADQSMILLWYKLCDDVADNGFFRSLPSRILRGLFSRSYHTAAQAQPVFDQCVKNKMELLGTLESEQSPRLDRVADTFASLLSAAALEDTDAAKHRPMEQLLYHLGRWIYLVDACDDLEEDLSKSRYNPLNARFCGKAAEEKEYINVTLDHSVNLISAAANLLDFGPWTAVVENVINTGLPAVQRAVLNGRWKEMKKQGRRPNERSV